MVKKKLVALGVSVAAVTAVVGAGFAGWTFTSEAKQEQKLGINITAAYSFGSIAIDTNAPDTVVLDQSGVTLAKNTALDKAITDIVATWTVNTESYNNAVTAGLTYTVNVYVKDGLGTYVNCGSTAASTDSATAKTGYTHYVFTPTTATATTNATDGTKSDIKMTVTPGFEYVSGQKPTTFPAYQAMVTAITGESTVTTDTAYTVAATDAPVIIEFVVTKTTA